MIETDEKKVMQVLLCLYSNAVKFTQDETVRIVVKIIKTENDTFLQI